MTKPYGSGVTEAYWSVREVTDRYIKWENTSNSKMYYSPPDSPVVRGYRSGDFFADGWSWRQGIRFALYEADGIDMKNGTKDYDVYAEQWVTIPEGVPATHLSVLVSEVTGTCQMYFITRATDGSDSMTSTKNLSAGLNELNYDGPNRVTRVGIRLRADASLRLHAAKLEIGAHQTLAHQDGSGNWILNEVPVKAEELLKCCIDTSNTSDTYANNNRTAAVIGAVASADGIVANDNPDPLVVKRDSENPSRIRFENAAGVLGYLGYEAGQLYRWSADGRQKYKVFDGSDALTAEDVGARPNDWMPTAEDVGARPNDWMPTAEQVGSLSVNGGTLDGALTIQMQQAAALYLKSDKSKRETYINAGADSFASIFNRKDADNYLAVHLAPETSPDASLLSITKKVQGESRSFKLFHAGNPPTAAQVGARPDDWMPTAEQVGARPDDWMPTAEQVGARPATWFPTPDEIDAVAITEDAEGNPGVLLQGDITVRKNTPRLILSTGTSTTSGTEVRVSNISSAAVIQAKNLNSGYYRQLRLLSTRNTDGGYNSPKTLQIVPSGSTEPHSYVLHTNNVITSETDLNGTETSPNWWQYLVCI